MTSGKDSSDEPGVPRDPAEQPEPAEDVADSKPQDTEHEDAAETVIHAARSEDRPMERRTPQAPFALVGLSYLAILAVIGLIIGLVLFWLSR